MDTKLLLTESELHPMEAKRHVWKNILRILERTCLVILGVMVLLALVVILIEVVSIIGRL